MASKAASAGAGGSGAGTSSVTALKAARDESKRTLPSALQPLPAAFATHLPADSGTYSPSFRLSAKGKDEGRGSAFDSSPTKHLTPPQPPHNGQTNEQGAAVHNPSTTTSTSIDSWQATAARVAPVLQSSVSSLISGDATWRPVKLQLVWSLLLLCLKRPENREYGFKLQRAKLSPLILQLENAATSQAAIAKAMDGKFSKSALLALNQGGSSSSSALGSPLLLFKGGLGIKSASKVKGDLSPSPSLELPVSTSARSSDRAGERDSGGGGAVGRMGSPFPSSGPFYNPHLTPGGLTTQPVAFNGGAAGPSTPPPLPPFVVPFDAPGWSGRKYGQGGSEGVVFTLSPFPTPTRQRGPDPNPDLNPGQVTPSRPTEPDSPTLLQTVSTDESRQARRTAGLSDDDEDEEMIMIRKEVALLEASGLSPLRPALPQAPSSATGGKHQRNASTSSGTFSTNFSPATRRLGF